FELSGKKIPSTGNFGAHVLSKLDTNGNFLYGHIHSAVEELKMPTGSFQTHYKGALKNFDVSNNHDEIASKLSSFTLQIVNTLSDLLVFGKRYAINENDVRYAFSAVLRFNRVEIFDKIIIDGDKKRDITLLAHFEAFD